jgi:sterol desaturase/sphingolipid hydroxylase (fatty acid hydroxylase superfamily)
LVKIFCTNIVNPHILSSSSMNVLASASDFHHWISLINPTPFDVPLGYAEGVKLALETTVVMAAFELISFSSVKALIKENAALYRAGWLSTLVNNFVLGPFAAYIAFGVLCVPKLANTQATLVAVLGLLAIHAIGYYVVHRAMHTKTLYWAHKFHHKFNAHVVPTSANAVSLTEYCLAYMLPFIVGAILIRPDSTALHGAAAVVSLNNILIHTPPLARISAALLPAIFVGTDRHLEHHRKLSTNYAAPTVSVDFIVNYFPPVKHVVDGLFDALLGRPVAVQSQSAAKKKMI